MQVSSWYNLKQSPRVNHNCQHIRISNPWFNISICVSLLKKAEVIFRRPPGKDPNDVLSEKTNWWRL